MGDQFIFRMGVNLGQMKHLYLGHMILSCLGRMTLSYLGQVASITFVDFLAYDILCEFLSNDFYIPCQKKWLSCLSNYILFCGILFGYYLI